MSKGPPYRVHLAAAELEHGRACNLPGALGRATADPAAVTCQLCRRTFALEVADWQANTLPGLELHLEHRSELYGEPIERPPRRGR